MCVRQKQLSDLLILNWIDFQVLYYYCNENKNNVLRKNNILQKKQKEK